MWSNYPVKIKMAHGFKLISLPDLTATLTNDLLVLFWPRTASPFLLYSTTHLAPGVSWSPVAAVTTNLNGQIVTTLSLTDYACFYELRAPGN